MMTTTTQRLYNYGKYIAKFLFKGQHGVAEVLTSVTEPDCMALARALLASGLS